MSDYTKTTNFLVKDGLLTGNPLKVVKGSEIDTEFTNIATAITSKADLASPTFTGTPIAPTAAVDTNTTQIATTAFVIGQAYLKLAGGTLTGLVKLAKGADIASAATVNLSTATGNTVHITGTTTISAWAMTSGQVMDVIFDGILTLTYHATNNNLPGGASITTAANDRARLFYDGATTWVLSYTRASGAPVAIADASITASKLSGAQSGSAPIYGARAWARFNGGTTAIAASGNVSSVSRAAAGDYTVNFTIAMADTNYATIVTKNNIGTNSDTNAVALTFATGSVGVRTNEGGVGVDCSLTSVVVFR